MEVKVLRLSELYTSVQGEGPRTGTSTVFVRFAGCNMRCPGWPCDTQHAIDPKIYRFQSEKLDPVELAAMIEEHCTRKGARNICLTGGEPFMQPSDDLHKMITALAHPSRWATFEVFTNGSYPFPEWTKEPMINMQYTMDWKLKGSGESQTGLAVRRTNALWLKETDAIKFVVKDEDDMIAAREIAWDLSDKGCKAQYWMGKVWGGELTDQDLVDYMQNNTSDWKLNVQTHKYIWHPDERGV
jgi:7-carboxy-7-deazaguanine synthase